MGRRGRWFGDFAVGDAGRRPLGRTVLEADSSRLSLITRNTAPLHRGRYDAGATSCSHRPADPIFTLALVTGQGAGARRGEPPLGRVRPPGRRQIKR